MSPTRAVFVIGLLAALTAAGGLRADDDDGPVVERGTFVLHLYKRPTGKETYEIRGDGHDLVLKADYENTDRGTKEPLTATLRLREGRVPERFEVKGRTSRYSGIDSEVKVEGKTATVREGKITTTRPVPDRFFFAGGFAPVSVQMMLIRDWERAHGAGPLETLPSGSVTIEKRGRDTVEIAGKRGELDRYSVGGVIWGRETLWFDPERKLVAAVTVDAEFNRFEAIREGFEAGLADLRGPVRRGRHGGAGRARGPLQPEADGSAGDRRRDPDRRHGGPAGRGRGRDRRGRHHRHGRPAGAGRDPGRRAGP